MCLRFVFLMITRLVAWLQLSRREQAWRTAEILNLRHQLTVLQRRQPRHPKLNWADRALLTTLLGVIPKAWAPRAAAAGHPGHDPALAPQHRPPPLGRQVRARQDRPADDPQEHQGTGPPAGPGKSRLGVPQDPRRAGRPGSLRSQRRPSGRSSRPAASTPPRYWRCTPAVAAPAACPPIHNPCTNFSRIIAILLAIAISQGDAQLSAPAPLEPSGRVARHLRLD
jgi:hypothetical protein